MSKIVLTRAIIVEVLNDGYQAKVRIPTINKSAESASATPDSALYTATICCEPGCEPLYRKDDVVFVSFEEGREELPVIMGLLSRKTKTEASSNLTTRALNVDVTCKLPEETTIGSISASDLSQIKNIQGNIQGQINLINDRTIITENNKNLTIKDYVSNKLTNLLLPVYDWKWKVEMYPEATMAVNILDTLNTLKVKRTRYIDDSATSISLNLGDHYTGKCTTFVYCPEEVTNLTMVLTTKDAGAFFINDIIQTNTSGKQITTSGTTSTFNKCCFKQGWNKIVVCYTESTSSDGWTFSTKFWDVSVFNHMNCLGGSI